MSKNIFEILANNDDDSLTESHHQDINIIDKDIIEVNNDDKKVKLRVFPINNQENELDEKWSDVGLKKKNTRKIDVPIKSYDRIALRKIDVPIKSNDTTLLKNIDDSLKQDEIKKKSFSIQNVKKSSESVILPDYYQKRMSENEYEIPQCEYEWVKRVGGLEKSDSLEHMWKGAMACAISYFENKGMMKRNKFFSSKISSELAYDENKQDNLIELICIQTTAILFHRLIKSDSIDNIKILLNNLPLYKAVPGNPVETTDISRSIGANSYMRIRYKFINDLRTIQNKRGISTNEEIKEANLRIALVEKKWMNYIIQSVWNGNNPTHDCLYYGAYHTFELLLQYYLKLNMQKELKNMLTVPNIQNESHFNIVENGKKACEKQSAYIIRESQFKKCEIIYNSTIKLLLDYLEVEPIQEQIINNKSEYDGDNLNVHSLINTGNIEGMISHIIRNKDNKNIIINTLNIWNSIVQSDTSDILCDYLEDVKSDNIISEILKNI
jgi:hypothetical protein